MSSNPSRPRQFPILESLGLLLLFSLAVPASAQEASSREQAEPPPIPLHEEILGDYEWPITTRSREAQDYFNQGARLMYAYTTGNAVRSFAEARRLDPDCAMCWWGEAWALGPFLNGGMAARNAPAAHAAMQRARALAENVTPVERALIRAMGVRYAPTHPEGGRRGLDSAYVALMADVYASFPAHPEVGMLYADALMLLEPRRGVWSVEKPSVRLIHQVLEGVLAQNIGHPGACHAYVHATETTPKVVDAQRCADLLGSSIPGASHINHMPSHTYNRVGRWGDATRANIQAWHTDLRAGRGEGFAIYPSHNLHMLLFSAAMDGQGALSIQAARDHAKLDPGNGAGLQALVLVRFGRFDEVLELTQPVEHPVHAGLLAFGRGLAHLRLQRPDSAAHYLARVDSIAEHAPDSFRFRLHSSAQLLGIVGSILRGEMLRAEGRVDEAIAELERAVAREGELMYDEPEPLPLAARDYLGALLLEAGRPVAAEAVYRAALMARPHNGWSLKGLELSLREQGRTAEAEEARKRFETAWARSEVWLPASRF